MARCPIGKVHADMGVFRVLALLLSFIPNIVTTSPKISANQLGRATTKTKYILLATFGPRHRAPSLLNGFLSLVRQFKLPRSILRKYTGFEQRARRF
jgi:hypothetical protein